MLLVGDASNRDLSESIGFALGLKPIYPEVTVFPDSEKRVRIPQEVSGETVYLLKSVTIPVDSSVLELSFLASALVNNGADKIIGIVPYIPYMRADHVFRTGEGVPLDVIIKMIETSGIHELIIVDPHSAKTPEVFNIPLSALSAVSLFADKIKEIEQDKENITIVSPDMGGIRRLDILSDMLGGVNQVVINKDRDYESGSVKVAEYKGEIKGTCFIVDDIISTGKTIGQAVDTLFDNNAKGVCVFGTHAVFSENASELLQSSKAQKIFITDSIPVSPQKKFEKLEILSLADLISSSIKENL